VIPKFTKPTIHQIITSERTHQNPNTKNKRNMLLLPILIYYHNNDDRTKLAAKPLMVMATPGSGSR
jgi:hypothetical protein